MKTKKKKVLAVLSSLIISVSLISGIQRSSRTTSVVQVGAVVTYAGETSGSGVSGGLCNAVAFGYQTGAVSLAIYGGASMGVLSPGAIACYAVAGMWFA